MTPKYLYIASESVSSLKVELSQLEEATRAQRTLPKLS